MEAEPKIMVEETNLEDLILLGEEKLINITIEYPTENGNVKTKAKIKQLTIKEIKNMNLNENNVDIEVAIEILKKSLYKQDETPFSKDLILLLPVGVATAIAEQILKVSGIDKDLGFWI